MVTLIHFQKKSLIVQMIFVFFGFVFCCHENYWCSFGPSYPRVVWSYWDDENEIPEDVEEMIDVTKKSLINFTHILLTERNLSDYLNVYAFPPYFSKLTRMHMCDYYRFYVLVRYGGVYVDTTTYIISGNQMEWFLLEAMKSQAEIFGYGHGKRPATNFLGAPHYSKFLTNFLKELDKTLSGEKNFYQYCENNFCSDKKKKNCRGQISECFTNTFFNYIRRNPKVHKNILVHPHASGHYRLSAECKNNFTCVRSRLINDPKIRSYPFIKVNHRSRFGKRLNFWNQKEKDEK